VSDWVFVYGTLKRAGANHALVASFVQEVTSGGVPGALLDLGGYPGWVEGEGMVWGEALRIAPPAAALAVLDELEEYFGPGDPRNLYERVEVGVQTPGGSLAAWAYRYVGPREGSRVVAGGEWRPE